MLDSIVPIIVAILSGGLLQYVISIIIDHRRRSIDIQQAEANIYNQSADMALKLAEGLSKRVDDLETDLSEQTKRNDDLERMLKYEKSERMKLQKKVDSLTHGVKALEQQIRGLGHKPVYTLEDE